MCQSPKTYSHITQSTPSWVPPAKDGAALGDSPPPIKFPQPKHHFYCILISTFLGRVRKTQAFAAAARGFVSQPLVCCLQQQ